MNPITTHRKTEQEFHIYCDFDSDTALVRIFRYRNNVWCGGKVYEMKRYERPLVKLAEFITKYGVENRDLLLQKEIFWNGKTEKAVVYKTDTKKKAEIKNDIK